MYTKKNNRGFTLLLAALVSSIVLALGASIYTLARKEVTLSSLGRDSENAFYSADQAAECALYWDARWSYFATSTPAVLLNPPAPLCDGSPVTITQGTPTLSAYPYSMTFQYSPTSAGVSYCATVRVSKNRDAQGVIATVIHADGFSTTCTTESTDPHALQRSVELSY